MSYYIDTLSKSTAKIKEDFVATKQIWHNASAGTLREKLVNEIIVPYIPDCFGVSSGLCYDRKENKSKQLDLVVYDKLYSYKLPFSDSFSVFPCESVYGNIEVKTNLNNQSIQDSIDNILSLKSLERDDATEFDFFPNLRLTVGNKEMGTKKNYYFGIVFAYESSEVKTIMKNIEQSNKPKDNLLLPDAFILLDKKTIIMRYGYSNGGITLNINGNSTGYIPINVGDDIIAYFIMYLQTILHSSHLRAMNPGMYFINDIKTKNIELDKLIQF